VARLALWLFLLGCSKSEVEHTPPDECELVRASLIKQLQSVDDRLDGIAKYERYDPMEASDTPLGRVRAADDKFLVPAYAKRRELIPGLREALTAVMKAWSSGRNPQPASVTLLERLTAFEAVFAPAIERMRVSVAEARTLPADPELQRYIEQTERWITGNTPGVMSVVLRKELDAAKLCAPR